MRKVDKYYVEDYFGEKLFTAGVVRKDNEDILRAEGFKALRFRHHKDGSLIVKVLRLINAVVLAFSCSKNSIVVFHLPLHAGVYKLLMQLLKFRGISTIGLLIDLDGVRDNNNHLLNAEITILKKFDCIIVHNNAMANFIQQYIAGAKMVPIEIFDYPFSGEVPKRSFTKKICIAANFGKASYVYDLPRLSNLEFFLYGSSYEETKQYKNDHIFYKGIVVPDRLPTIAEGSFGLVWDGASPETCDPYLKINNPHKLSLYLAAGMPVIVWDKSAVAAFVKKHNIGITVNSLSEIESKLNAASEEAYGLMQQNASVIAGNLRSGSYLKKAMGEAISLIEQNAKL